MPLADQYEFAERVELLVNLDPADAQGRGREEARDA